MAGRPSRNTLILLVVGCIAVFTVGIILLVVGFVKYTRPYPSVPYMWSLNLCQVNNTEKWVGLPLGEGEGCPPDPLGSASPQSFAIPKAPILFPDVPYNPVLYVTNKVTGIISFSHKVHGEVVFSTSVMLSSLEVTKFAVCGGAELVVFRNGPVAGSEGDYISSDFCHNNMTGCQYEPGRSLNSYKFEGVRVDLDTIPEEGSELVVDSIILEADYTHIIMPDALIHYEVGGRGEEQSVGLVLLALGAIMADLMPAAVYFLLSKPAVPS